MFLYIKFDVTRFRVVVSYSFIRFNSTIVGHENIHDTVFKFAYYILLVIVYCCRQMTELKNCIICTLTPKISI